MISVCLSDLGKTEYGIYYPLAQNTDTILSIRGDWDETECFES